MQGVIGVGGEVGSSRPRERGHQRTVEPGRMHIWPRCISIHEKLHVALAQPFFQPFTPASSGARNVVSQLLEARCADIMHLIKGQGFSKERGWKGNSSPSKALQSHAAHQLHWGFHASKTSFGLLMPGAPTPRSHQRTMPEAGLHGLADRRPGELKVGKMPVPQVKRRGPAASSVC